MELIFHPITHSLAGMEGRKSSGEVVAGRITGTSLEPVSEAFPAFAYPGDGNPVAIYLGSLDSGSLPTMRSTARRAVRVLTGGRTEDSRTFPWHLLRYQHVTRLRQLLRQEGVSPRTVNKTLVLIRRVLKEAWRLDLIHETDYRRAVDVESVKSDDLPAGRYVTPEEIRTLLDACLDGTPAGRRDAAIVAVLAGGGLRRKEATHLDVEDYDAATGDLKVKHGKRKKQRMTYLQPEARSVLTDWLRHRAPLGAGPVFVPIHRNGSMTNERLWESAIDAILKRRADSCERFAHFSPHDLRRSFITNMLEQGMDAVALAKIVGHESPETTMLYDRREATSHRDAVRRTTMFPERKKT